MAAGVSESDASSTHIRWKYNGSADPFSKTKPPEWKTYSDTENMMIEEAYAKKEPHAMLDDYHIDFKHNLQISNSDENKQRPVKRFISDTDTHHLREERFTFTPIDPKRPFAGLYGWVSPLIKETAKYLDITKDNLPSKNKETIPKVIKQAAKGIVEEASLIGRKREGEYLAKLLLEKEKASMEDVWKRCAYIYSLETFFYKKLNEIMRLIGNPDYESVWRSKVRTLGPFCLLLWDNPSTVKPADPGVTLYRGADLSEETVSAFKKDCLLEDRPMRSFPSFTSCSRLESKAKGFGNVLFIMTVKHAFSVDIKKYSKYPDEEEELIFPGVCFTVDHVVDKGNNKYWIYLDLIQQHRQSDIQEVSNNGSMHLDHLDDNPYYLNDYRSGHADDWNS